MNKVALITGASKGIGLHISKHLYLQNYNLILVSRKKKDLLDAKSIIQTCRTGGGKIYIIDIDLSKKDTPIKLFNYTTEQNLVVDVLVNNAGIGLHSEHVILSPEAITSMLLLNINTLTTLCSLFGAGMKKRKSGYILNIASTAAYQPVPFFAAYAASKSYVLNFTEALAAELKGDRELKYFVE